MYTVLYPFVIIVAESVRAKEGVIMKLFLILIVAISFISAIFTAGYNDPPEADKIK
jgi:hypothetical protein